jgi:thiamine-phosphate diphosphorylase
VDVWPGPGGGAPFPVIPRLHLVTDDEVLGRPTFLREAEAVLAAVAAVRAGAAGAGPLALRHLRLALHLRGPRTPGGSLLRLTRQLAPLAGEAGVLLLVNDRVDVALAGGAHGVQLGTRSLRPSEARALLLPGSSVGASVHGTDEAAALLPTPPDFLLVGTIFPTPSHPGEAGGGMERIRTVAQVAPRIPLIAIGGVTLARFPRVLEAGAHGAAVMRAVWDSESPGEAVREFLGLLG